MRFFLLPLMLSFLVVLIVTRLASIQIFQGKYYSALSNNNRIRTNAIHAPRGIIFDRLGVPLVFNTPGFRLVEKDKTTFLSHEEATKYIAKGEKNIGIDSLRQYPYKEVFSHVVGYIGQITKEELRLPQFVSYRLQDTVGKSGIEQMYESKLKGVDGKQLVEVDAMGKAVRILGQEDPLPGKDVTLTLDARLSQVLFLAMRDVNKGAAIVSTPTGEILAMLSQPSFDPNLFTMGDSYKSATESAYKNVFQALSDSRNQPFLNRAISGVYPPGSTFKLVTAAAGLENKKIDEHFTVVDTGILQVGAFSFGNWYFLQYGRTEGEVDVVKGIKRSNDIFFYKVAELLGVESLSAMAKKLGLGEKTGIDLVGEAKGLVPSDAWKREVIGEQWYLGDTYHYGIGQGYLLTTPLQVNTWTQAIANGGVLYEPHLLKSQISRLQSPEATANGGQANLKSQKLITDKTRELIREGMIQSCSPGGVAWPLFEFKVSVACKTGTAQHGSEKDLPHAWITLFAPAYDPQIIVTVLAESSGEGSNIAAPIAKKILEEWFSR